MYYLSTLYSGVLQGLHLLMEERFSTPDSSTPTPFTTFLSFATSLVLPALKEVGWEGGSGEDFKTKILRSTIISLLDTFCVHEETIFHEAHSRFTKHFADTHALPADYKGTVYRMVLQRGGADVYEKVLSVYRDTQDNQVRKYVMYTLGATKDVSCARHTPYTTLHQSNIYTIYHTP
ncbi:hypothetical protein EON63_03795 [archaeon]|nr:MAG: hypothetical protein EON63_03795 [archaeon]